MSKLSDFCLTEFLSKMPKIAYLSARSLTKLAIFLRFFERFVHFFGNFKNIFKEKVYIYFIIILKFMYTYFLFMIPLLLHNLD